MLTLLMPYVKTDQSSLDDCVLYKQTLSCGSSLPEVVPPTVTAVFVRDYKKEAIPQQQFSHMSWQNITTLDIIATNKPFVISPGNFRFLKTLNSLGIHGRDVDPRSKSFSGLVNLTSLDMSACYRLVPNKLFRVLLEDISSLIHLRYLNLKYLNAAYNKVLRLDELFFKVLTTFPIEQLSLSGTILMYAAHPSRHDVSWSVKHLDISNVSFVVSAESFSGSDFIEKLFGNLEFINISNTPARFFGQLTLNSTQQNVIRSSEDGYCDKGLYIRILKLKNVFANNVMEGFLTMDRNNTLDISGCGKSALQVVHLRGNRFRKLNLTMISYFNSLVEVDLSSNNMIYISPTILPGGKSLEVLILKNNELSNMEKLSDFEYLIENYEKLLHFDISMNKLSHIPPSMFKYNSQLRELDLSDNMLVSISMTLANLSKLKLLKLKNNKILMLDSVTISAINSYLRNQTGQIRSFSIELHNNPLVCSCESLEFLQWVVDDLAPRTKQRLTCSLDDRVVDIDHVAIEEAKDSCTTVVLTPSFWVILAVYGVAVVVVTSLFVRYLLHVRREHILLRMKNDFILKYKQGELKEKHIIFLSENLDTTDMDDDIAFVHVMENLEKELIHMIDGRVCDKVIVSDRIRGQIGVYRDEAADKFIAQSCIVVILISVAEPDNRYFKTDLELAKAYNKPICLLSRRLPDRPALKQCLRHFTIDLVLRNNVWLPQMGWEAFCGQILTMAAEKHYEINEKMQKRFDQF